MLGSVLFNVFINDMDMEMYLKSPKFADDSKFIPGSQIPS